MAQRYTLSHMAHDVKNQTGLGEPTRDWFPISFMSTFSDFADLVHGPNREWGQISCGCHPNCGIGMAIMIDKETKEAVPVTAFLNADRLAKDIAKLNDAARGRFLSLLGISLALMRNYNPIKAPTHMRIMDLLKKFDKFSGSTKRNYGSVKADRTMADIEKRRADRWNFLFIAGMWFQDLFNYDFRRTEQCIIPYATQEGEISFCAYNTGVGWRNIIEKMHMTATLTKWYEEHGRHEIFAGGKKVGMGNITHDLLLNQEHVTAAANDTFEKSGIAKNAREEKLRARDTKIKQDAENAKMARLYREHVLGEKPKEGFIPLDTLIAPAPKPAPSGQRRAGYGRLVLSPENRKKAANNGSLFCAPMRIDAQVLDYKSIGCRYESERLHYLWREKPPTLKSTTSAEQYERIFWSAVKAKNWQQVPGMLAANVMYSAGGKVLSKDQVVPYLQGLNITDFTITGMVVKPNGPDMTLSYTLQLPSAGGQIQTFAAISVWQQVSSGWILIAYCEQPQT